MYVCLNSTNGVTTHSLQSGKFDSLIEYKFHQIRLELNAEKQFGTSVTNRSLLASKCVFYYTRIPYNVTHCILTKHRLLLLYIYA